MPMSKKITLQLRDEIIARALAVADHSERDLEEVLSEWLDRYVDDLPMESLPDDEVLAWCHFELSPMSEYELRTLLYRHRHYDLTNEEHIRLDELLQTYRRGVVRQARALQVAIARGLQGKPVS